MQTIRQLMEKIKIFESPDLLRTEIEKKIRDVNDETDLSDILKFTNRYTIKSEVDKFSAVRSYKDHVNREILKALANTGLDKDRVKKFLDKLLIDGILNTTTLLTPRIVHKAEDIITTAYKDTFDLIKISLFQEIAGKIGEKGDVGKGEYLLDIISPDVKRRGAPGDLSINGTNIELKAGENGRLGPAGSMSLVGRFDTEFLPTIKDLVPHKVDMIGNITKFNLRLDMSYFSDFFEEPKKIKTALTKLLVMHYGQNAESEVSEVVSSVVDATGKIKGDKLKAELLGLSFAAYKKEKSFDGIIIMDSGVTAFMYISSPEDIKAVANSMIVIFPSWTDVQSNCVKITLSKTAMASGASSKASIAKSISDHKLETKEKIQDVISGHIETSRAGETKTSNKTVSEPRKRKSS